MAAEKHLSIYAEISYKTIQQKPGLLQYDVGSHYFTLYFLDAGRLTISLRDVLPLKKWKLIRWTDTMVIEVKSGNPTQPVNELRLSKLQPSDKQALLDLLLELVGVKSQMLKNNNHIFNKHFQHIFNKQPHFPEESKVPKSTSEDIELEKKLHNSEVQNQQISERNRQLTNELHTSEDKNQESLERIRELEQELSNSQAKIRDLEAKFAQTDVGQVIALLKEKVDKLENGEISRLQIEVAKLSNESAKVKEEFSDLQKRFETAEKQNNGLIKDKAEMSKELKSWEHLRQLLSGANEYAEGIGKTWKQQNQDFGSNGDSAKKARTDPNKPEDGAKNAENEASLSFENLL